MRVMVGQASEEQRWRGHLLVYLPLYHTALFWSFAKDTRDIDSSEYPVPFLPPVSLPLILSFTQVMQKQLISQFTSPCSSRLLIGGSRNLFLWEDFKTVTCKLVLKGGDWTLETETGPADVAERCITISVSRGKLDFLSSMSRTVQRKMLPFMWCSWICETVATRPINLQ